MAVRRGVGLFWMNKRRVLFLIESLAGGGAEKVLTTLVQHIDSSKFDVTVCVISGGGKYEQDVKSVAHYYPILSATENYRGLMKLWYNLKYHLIYDWLPLSLVYRLFVPKGSDVEVAFVEGFATKLMASSSNKKAKKIAWVHCDMARDHWTRRIFKSDDVEYSCYKRFKQVVTMSNTQKHSLSRVYPQLDVKVCYNPIDSDQILTLSMQDADSVPPNIDIIRLVSTGRLAPVKAFDRLLRIVKRLRQDNISCELWLLGDGTERNTLEQYVKENALEEVVKFWGFQSNPYKYLAQCDLFVCSSISEGFSTAITEALILGLPVVSTEVSGVREQLTNGCGIITENDEEALYQGLKTVLDHPERLKEMREKAIERGKDFQIESLMKEIENVLS